jgi:hypothetical protein
MHVLKLTKKLMKQMIVPSSIPEW